MPETKEDLVEWFRRYGKFVSIWTKIAKTERVDILGIGSELRALSATKKAQEIPNLESWYLDKEKQAEDIRSLRTLLKDTDPKDVFSGIDSSKETLENFLLKRSSAWREWAKKLAYFGATDSLAEINKRRELLKYHWLSLIKKVKKDYPGKLTYAANFDEYQRIDFWNELDFLGLNAYFKLQRQVSEDLYVDLILGWSRVFEEIALFQAENKISDMSLLFTELGYTFRKGSTLAPWASDGATILGEAEDRRLVIYKNQELSFDERVLAIKTLREVSEQSTAKLAGILYWKLSTY